LLYHALTGNESLPLQSGETLEVLPSVDDQGALNVGDGTTDMDVKVFLGSTAEYVELDVGNSRVNLGADDTGIDLVANGATASANMTWDASADELVFNGASAIRPKYEIVNKTASYTITSADFGKIFTNRGDGDAIIFTLPAASGNAGEVVEFYSVSDNDFSVTGTDEELVTLNDLTADKVGWATASEKIGGGFKAICDGTSWLMIPYGTETQTLTITSA